MTPERRREAEKAGEAYHAALAALGVAAFDELLNLWLSLPESQAAPAVERWINQVGAATAAHRRQARDLTWSYYRLIRALRTGSTIATPTGVTGTVTLSSLRSDFASQVEDITEPPDIAESVPETDLEVVVEEEVDGLAEDEREADLDAVEAQRDFILANLADYRRKLEQARTERDRRKAEADAATLTASSGQKGAMDGGRSTLHSVADADRRAIGFVRLSRTGDPCAFCRMLMSRGITFGYSSRQSATFKADGEKYHTNCQCYGEPVFSEEQYENDPRFALNRELSALWPSVTDGYSGRDALNAWRRYWYSRSKTVNPNVRAPAA